MGHSEMPILVQISQNSPYPEKVVAVMYSAADALSCVHNYKDNKNRRSAPLTREYQA